MAHTPLTPAERARYHRHLLLDEIGDAGQRRLAAARVLLVGAGGLGSPAALYLAAAGVGCLGVVDDDRVDLSNLQRQVIYRDADLGRPKATAAAAALRARNPHISVVEHPERLTAEGAERIAADYDLIVDGADNFATRYLVNDLAVLTGRRVVYAAIMRFDGQATVFGLGGPCYRCLYPAPPPAAVAPNCAEAGVLGVLPGLLGVIQATEAIKLIVGAGDPLVGRLLMVDALAMRFHTVKVPRDPRCAVCGEAPTITSLADTAAVCAAEAQSPWDIAVDDYARHRTGALIDVRTPAEAAAASIGGRLIPLDTLAGHIDDLRALGRVVVHCQRGGRSARAVEMLRAAGVDAHNLRGGLDAWRVAGLPLRGGGA